MTARVARTGQRPRRRMRGGLSMLALMLAGSAVIRVGPGLGEAVAQASVPLDQPAPEASDARQASPDPVALLDSVRNREAAVSERERALEERMQALSVAETRVEDRLAALRTAEEELAGTLALADEAAESDLARLTEVYENMDPDEAAALFEEMAPEFSAGFLGRMQPAAAAEVMAGLAPRTAYTISAILAGRNASVPTE